MDKEIFTGERFIPGIEDEMLAIEHIQRYQSVRELVRGKIVLDAACGEGYGSSILSETARRVVGIDICGDTIRRAEEKYGDGSRISFRKASIDTLPLEDRSVDVVISFETIEHVDEAMQRGFLTEIRRVLKDDGILIISTPNKEVYSDQYHYHNEFHVKEFYEEDFCNFLRQSFRNIKLFYQYFEVTGVIDDPGSDISRISFSRYGNYEGNGKYMIAIAGNRSLDQEELQSVMLGKSAKYRWCVDRILQLQEEEEERNRHIGRLDREILKKDRAAAEAKETISVLKCEADTKEREINSLKKINEYLETQNGISEKNLFQLKERLQENVVQSRRLSGQVKEQEARIEQFLQELKNKEGHIQQLLEVERAFEREKGTRGYRLCCAVRKLIAAILPPNSKREFCAYVLMQCFRNPKLMLHMINPTRIRTFLEVSRKEGMDAVWYNYRLTEDFERIKSGDKNVQQAAEQPGEEKKISEYPILEFTQWKVPDVSIIIPVYNQFAYTYCCLESILKYSGDIKYEVIVADDCSTDLTCELNKAVRGIRILNNSNNLRFLLNCNHAAEYAKGKYILFLNNDTQVRENWLSSLVSLMETNETIGMVGSKLIYPDGHLQEAGGIVWKDGSAWNYGQKKMPDDPEYNYVKDADYISGAAIMIRSELWKQIGGFDERYAPAYYEDTDLAFEVRKRGYRVVYQPLSVVVHFEGISNGRNVNEGLKAYQIENAEKFREKWRDTLEKEHFPNGEEVFLAKDRSRFKKHILVVDHYVPNYDKDAGGKCTYMYLKTFLKMGMKVTFIGDNFAKMEPYTTELNQLGIEILYGNYYYNNWQEWLKNNLKYFDFVYLQRPHISIKYIDIVKKYGRARIFYFAHDLHHLREYRQYQLDHNPETLKSSEHWKKIEYELFEKADVGHVVGSYEQAIMQKAFPDKPIRNIPLYIYEDELSDIQKDFSQREDIMYVGGFGHPPNEDAVLWFAKEVFPKVLKQYPSMKWHVVGSKVTKAVQELNSENILIEGFQPDEVLHRLYRKCRMAVVPLRYGAGVKGKVVESAYFQIPLVTTSIGAEGLDCEDDPFVIEDDADKMAEKICSLYEDYDKLRILSDKGKDFIRKNFTLRVAEDVLRADMEL